MEINTFTKTEIDELIKIRTKFFKKQIDRLKGRIDLLERKETDVIRYKKKMLKQGLNVSVNELRDLIYSEREFHSSTERCSFDNRDCSVMCGYNSMLEKVNAIINLLGDKTAQEKVLRR